MPLEVCANVGKHFGHARDESLFAPHGDGLNFGAKVERDKPRSLCGAGPLLFSGADIESIMHRVITAGAVAMCGESVRDNGETGKEASGKRGLEAIIREDRAKPCRRYRAHAYVLACHGMPSRATIRPAQ